MIVYGKPISEKILQEIKKDIQSQNLTPRLAIILAGTNAASRMYIKHKTKAGSQVGIEVSTFEFSEESRTECMEKIQELNRDTDTHGIIIQLPLYQSWPPDEFVNAVKPQKDVDGFVESSPFIPATAEGTLEMLKEFARLESFSSIEAFLSNKKIVVLGKGQTAGKPVRMLLKSIGFESDLIDSKTENPDKIIRAADVIISATGKKNIINSSNIKEGAYIIGIGVGKENINGEINTYGDVDEVNVNAKAKLLCPTIGGIGPLTIACLLRNVKKASEKNN